MRLNSQIIAGRAALVAVLTSAAVVGIRQERPVHAATTANVTVSAGTSLSTLPPSAFGLNTAVWDANLLDSSVPSLLKSAGVTALRFPGGSTSDNYHWQTNSVTNGGYANPNNTFDAFMKVAGAVGAQPVITVNYGSNSAGNAGGDPNEAASWVQYANVTRHYGIQYWEIGNEVYGNGTYGSSWENDLHSQKGPSAYATNALGYISAMKAVDPTIRIGLVLTAPGNWPDGQTPDWNSTVLSTACAKMDFAIVHWYPQGPGSETDAGLLGSTGSIAGMVSTLRSAFMQYCGARANQIGILVTETNSVSYNPGKQTVSLVNALFLADNYLTWLEHGVTNVDWWDLHNSIVTGTNTSPALYGTLNYGDYGMLADGTSSGGQTEPAAETPFPPYYGMQMLRHVGVGGDTLVGTTSSQPLVVAHAVRQANGNLAVLLVNKDPSTSYAVSVSLNGYTPASTATTYTYGEGSTAISSASQGGIGSTFTQAVAPYSLTTIVLSPSGAAPSATASATAAVTASATSAPSRTATSLPTATATATAPPASSPTVKPSATATATPASQSTATLTVVPSATVSATVAPPATATPAGTPSFSQSTGASPATVAPGGTVAISARITDTGGPLSNGVVDLEVYNSSGSKVGQQYYSGQSLTSGQSATYTWNWPAPAAAGTYTVKVGVFGANWSPNYLWADRAATFAVGAGSFSDSTQVSPATATQGSAVAISSTITAGSGALSNGIVDLEVYNAAGSKVGQQYYSGQTIAVGGSAGYSWNWPAPAAGTYTVKVGVFGANWSPNYLWDNGASTITVR